MRDEIAARVRAEMGRQRVSNISLAARLGVSDMWVSRRVRINPTRDFTITELERVARALGVPLSRLLPGDPTEVAR